MARKPESSESAPANVARAAARRDIGAPGAARTRRGRRRGPAHVRRAHRASCPRRRRARGTGTSPGRPRRAPRPRPGRGADPRGRRAMGGRHARRSARGSWVDGRPRGGRRGPARRGLRRPDHVAGSACLHRAPRCADPGRCRSQALAGPRDDLRTRRRRIRTDPRRPCLAPRRRRRWSPGRPARPAGRAPSSDPRACSPPSMPRCGGCDRRVPTMSISPGCRTSRSTTWRCGVAVVMPPRIAGDHDGAACGRRSPGPA